MRTAFLSFFLLGTLAPLTGQPARVGVNQPVVAQIPPRMKQYVDDKTVAGVVTLVAHGGDVV